MSDIEHSSNIPLEMAELSLIPNSLIISRNELTFGNKVLGAGVWCEMESKCLLQNESLFVCFTGEFGVVHKAHYKNEVVAVKTLKGTVNLHVACSSFRRKSFNVMLFIYNVMDTIDFVTRIGNNKCINSGSRFAMAPSYLLKFVQDSSSPHRRSAFKMA